MVLIISNILKKGIFCLKKLSTNTSFAALIMIGDDGYWLILDLSEILGNIFLSTFLKTKFWIFFYSKETLSFLRYSAIFRLPSYIALAIGIIIDVSW